MIYYVSKNGARNAVNGSDDQDSWLCGDRLIVHGGNEGSKRIILLISVSITVVRELLLFIIVRLGYFYCRRRKSLGNAAVGDDYIINITCDKTLTVFVNLEDLGWNIVNGDPTKHTAAHRYDSVKLVGENELSKLFPSILAHRRPVGCPIIDNLLLILFKWTIATYNTFRIPSGRFIGTCRRLL